MKMLLLRGFKGSSELERLLGPRLIRPEDAARLMLAKLTGNKVLSEAANSDDFIVRVCVASEDGVAQALRTLARHSGILLQEIKVHA